MVPVLEAVPNFSSGRDRALIERLARAVAQAGAEVLDSSSDPDHNRAVVTIAGPPAAVEDAAVAMARIAVDSIDLRRHVGVHPRIGALDVLPFVPLSALTMADAARSARRVGRRLADEIGLPVYFYAEASRPPGRRLAELRKGGFESLASGIEGGREPDVLPPGWADPAVHPSAGAVCVGARPLLLAWNVDVSGLDPPTLAAVAAELRETGGGPPGLRVLGLVLEGQGRSQLSMNLEDAARRDPFAVFEAVELKVQERGGVVTGTEVIGLAPDELLASAAAARLGMLDRSPERGVSWQLARHVSARASEGARDLALAVRDLGDAVPVTVKDAVGRLVGDLLVEPASDRME